MTTTKTYTVEAIRIEEEYPMERVVVASVTDGTFSATVWAVVGVRPYRQAAYRLCFADTDDQLSWPMLSEHCSARRFGDSLDHWCPPVWQHDNGALWDAIESRLIEMANVETVAWYVPSPLQ